MYLEYHISLYCSIENWQVMYKVLQIDGQYLKKWYDSSHDLRRILETNELIQVFLWPSGGTRVLHHIITKDWRVPLSLREIGSMFLKLINNIYFAHFLSEFQMDGNKLFGMSNRKSSIYIYIFFSSTTLGGGASNLPV